MQEGDASIMAEASRERERERGRTGPVKAVKEMELTDGGGWVVWRRVL